MALAYVYFRLTAAQREAAAPDRAAGVHALRLN